MTALAGYKGTLYGQSGVSVAFTNAPATDISTTRITYRLTADKRFLDSSVAPIVQTSPDGSTWSTVASNLYTFRYLGGLVTFTSARAVGTQVRVYANAYPMVEFAGFTSWSLDGERDLADVTPLNPTGAARQYIPLLYSGTVSAEGFWIDNYFFSKLTTNGIACLSLYPDASGSGRYDCYTYLSKVSPNLSVTETVNESREFTINGEFFYNT